MALTFWRVNCLPYIQMEHPTSVNKTGKGTEETLNNINIPVLINNMYRLHFRQTDVAVTRVNGLYTLQYRGLGTTNIDKHIFIVFG